MKLERNIVIVTTSFPQRGDGSEAAGSFVADLAVELAQKICVRVIAPGLGAGHEIWSANLEVFRYATPPGRTLSTLVPRNPFDLLWIMRVLRGGLAATRAAIDADTVSILAMWALPAGEWARRVALEKGIGYSVWMLGSDVWSLGKIPVVRSWLARVMRQATHAFADGYLLAADASRIGGVPVAFLPTTRKIAAVNPQPPRVSPPYRLLFLGRWHPNKGIDLLLEALGMLGDDDWLRIDCIEVFGGGPLDLLVRKRIAELHAQGRAIKLGGYLAKAQAEAAMARADWVVIPSRIESIPVIFSDAMKLGRPVVSMPVGDLTELVVSEPACGIVAQAADSAALCVALRRCLHTSTADYAIGVRNMAKRFDLDSIAARLFRDLAAE